MTKTTRKSPKYLARLANPGGNKTEKMEAKA